MATVPSLTSAFSSLLKPFSALTQPIPYSGVMSAAPNASAPNMSKLPATPNMSVYSAPVTQSKVATATPTAPFSPAPNMSTVNGPVYAPAPAMQSKPAVPNIAQSSAPQQGNGYVTTPSGAVVDPATGRVINGPTGGTSGPAIPALSQPTDESTTAAESFSSPTQGADSFSNYGSYGGASPTLPALPGGSTDYNPLLTSPDYESALEEYKKYSVPTQEEVDAMTNLNNLNTAAKTAYTNTQNQPIALDFITGQQAAQQRSQSALATPLQSQISLLQAKRQLAREGAETALGVASSKLAASRDLAKPISTTLGSTLSRYNPSTGKYETVVNPFGTAGEGTGANAMDLIGSAIAEGRLTQDNLTRYGMSGVIATLEKDPGYNFITQKASIASDSSSLKKQQDYADTTSRAFNTANDNLKNLIGFMQTAKINTASTVPAINELTNKVKAGLTDAGTIAAFQAGLAGLRAEYAQVLSRGGEVTEGQRAAALSLIPDNISPAQLQQVADRLNVEGQNAIKEANAKVKEIQGRIGTQGGSGGSSSSSSGSIYDF